MSFHPNDVARRARMSSMALAIGFVLLVGAFFKTQVIQYRQYVMQSEENRLRPIPLPAPRGIIYDRHGEVIAENLPAYSVSITAPSVDSLRSALAQLGPTLQLGQNDINNAIRRYRRAPTRPTVILPDATIDIVSVLEEHRLDFPRLIIQSVPKRYYPDGPVVASFVGYTGEITESDLNDPKYASYKPGQQIGKAGLEKQYEPILHGKEGVRFDEVDARGRPVRGEGPRPDLSPEGAPPLYTNIDLDLQKFTVGLFADSRRRSTPTSISISRNSRLASSPIRCRVARLRSTRIPAKSSRSTARRAGIRTSLPAGFLSSTTSSSSMTNGALS